MVSTEVTPSRHEPDAPDIETVLAVYTSLRCREADWMSMSVSRLFLPVGM